MTQAPERIWVEKSIAEEGNHGSTAWPEREDGSEVEYVRADLFPAVKPPFQSRVQPWMMECFGAEISADLQERNHRFLEEALELVQSTGCTAGEAHELVDYVFGRDVGEPKQEAGAVMVTLAALCLAADMDMHECGETELARVWTKVEKIRAKQAAKPKHSPLPQHVTTRPTVAEAEAQGLSRQLRQLGYLVPTSIAHKALRALAGEQGQ